MINNLKYILKYINYYLFAGHGRGYGIHSPFIYEYVIKVLRDRTIERKMKEINDLSSELRSEKTKVETTGFGAGSHFGKSKNLSIGNIARLSSTQKKYGNLLYRTVMFFKPKVILELGTSIGIGTSYLALPDRNANIYTIEGSEILSALAMENFSRLKISNIKQYTGEFINVLPGLLDQLPDIDLIFIDGDHREEATIKYFELCLEAVNSESVIIFDDIHWSGGMEKAWERIKKFSNVKLTLDLFRFGLVFFREEIYSKQHFRIRY
ncbi:MAG: class I SAM-dependent methyltransferase [Bacteroidales bacterium]|nr:class I SAM-dependent methyltransferase [Bacteroidales bacterium]